MIAIALSLDAMAVAAVSGTQDRHITFRQSLKIALSFGFFQFFMPLVGWIAGVGLKDFISGFDHWIAFLLLVVIGLKMLMESFSPAKTNRVDINNWKVSILLSLATSIDALIVGITFALLPVKIWFAAIMIGITTIILSLAAIYIGKKFGELWGKKSEAIGGLVLIGIGLKILLGHLF
jgi:putative Mn2+ efflux pump MntP